VILNLISEENEVIMGKERLVKATYPLTSRLTFEIVVDYNGKHWLDI
jgi:hypothetical protein